MTRLGGAVGVSSRFRPKSLHDHIEEQHRKNFYERFDRIEKKLDRIEQKIDRVDRRQITIGKVFVSLVIGKAIKYWWNR